MLMNRTNAPTVGGTSWEAEPTEGIRAQGYVESAANAVIVATDKLAAVNRKLDALANRLLPAYPVAATKDNGPSAPSCQIELLSLALDQLSRRIAEADEAADRLLAL